LPANTFENLLIFLGRMLFISLGCLTNVPASLWERLANLRPYSPVAKFAIIFGAWHVVAMLWCWFLALKRKRNDSKDLEAGDEPLTVHFEEGKIAATRTIKARSGVRHPHSKK
jgi:type VI protein secretion system component VasK